MYWWISKFELLCSASSMRSGLLQLLFVLVFHFFSFPEKPDKKWQKTFPHMDLIWYKFASDHIILFDLINVILFHVLWAVFYFKEKLSVTMTMTRLFSEDFHLRKKTSYWKNLWRNSNHNKKSLHSKLFW